MGFAFDLFLQVAQDDAVFLFHGGVHGVAVTCAYFFVDVEAGGAEDGALAGLSPYEFPGFFRVLHFHEDFYGGVGHHLLRAFFVRFQNTGVILGGDDGGYAETAPLCQHDLKAGGDDGRIFIHDAQIRADAHSVRGQGFQHVGGVAFNMCAEAHGTGVAYGGEADFSEAGQFCGGFFQRRQKNDQHAALHDGVGKIDFSVFSPVDVGIGVRQAGKGLSEVALGIAELLRKGLGLVFHFPSGNPAAGAESRMDGGAGLFIKLRPQREGDTFFKRQRFTDDAGGELEQPFVAQVHQGVHDAGNQRLRLVGKDAVRPVGRGHEGNKKLRQGFRTAEGEGIVGIGKTARSFSFDFAGSAVVQYAEVVVPSQKAGHLPYLYGEFRTCFRVDVEQPASRGQSVV